MCVLVYPRVTAIFTAKSVPTVPMRAIGQRKNANHISIWYLSNARQGRILIPKNVTIALGNGMELNGINP